MGDREKASLRLQFNPQIRLELHGATITSDAGLLAFRELDDALDLTPIASDYLQESRTGRNIRHHLVPLLRQSIYSRLAGYDDTNDAERLSQDPAMRVVVGWQGSDRNAARTNTMSRFETETLTQEDNLKGLALMNPQWVELAMAHTPHRRVILDIDSSESPVHGQQEGAAYNGHFECVCYHPLFLFNHQFGDCEGATLRPGNVHSADGWQELRWDCHTLCPDIGAGLPGQWAEAAPPQWLPGWLPAAWCRGHWLQLPLDSEALHPPLPTGFACCPPCPGPWDWGQLRPPQASFTQGAIRCLPFPVHTSQLFTFLYHDRPHLVQHSRFYP